MIAPILCLDATWPGRLGAPAIGLGLDAIVGNPWAPLVEQCADTTELRRLEWTRYHRPEAFEILDRERRTLFLRERAGDGAIEAQVWNGSDETSLILYVPMPRTAPADPRLRAHLGVVLAALPGGCFGSIIANTVEEPYPPLRLPPPFQRNPWIAALPPAHYQHWFTRESLLDAPATSVHEAADGTIWLQLYRDPVAPDMEEARSISRYLDRVVKRAEDGSSLGRPE